jgi:pimeloyl-ACP methyl ester carboxylesterase
MTLALLPGMDGTGELFRPFLAVASKSTKCVVASYPPKALAGWEDYVSFIEKVLPRNDEYILVAESFSGPFAVEIAGQEKVPQGLRGIVLCSSFVSCPIHPVAAPFAWTFGRFVMGLPVSRQAIRTFLLGRDSSDDLVDIVASAIKSVDRDVLWRRLRLLLQCDIRQTAANLKVRCLALAGDKDRLVSRIAQSELLEALGESNVTRINGAHLLMQTRPEDVLSAISDFVNRLKR